MINGPQLKVLSAEEVGTIYEKCMIVLSKKGVHVNHSDVLKILDTNAGEHFLERAHTLTHCREALPVSLFISQSWEDWVSEGEKNLYERALEKYSEIKKNLSTEPLSDDIQKELNRIVRKADKYLVR